MIWTFEAKGPVSRRGVAYWPGDRDAPARLFTRRRRGPHGRAGREDAAQPSPRFGEGGYVDLKASIRGDVDGAFSLSRRRSSTETSSSPAAATAKETQLRALRRHPRLGRAHRQAALVVPHGAACRRARRRDVGRRELEEPLGHQRVDVHDRRRRARARVRRRPGRRRRTSTARDRKGKNLYGNCARRARCATGKLKWYPAARAPRSVGLGSARRADARST